MVFVIERIRKKNGELHERHNRRKGHRVQIESIELGRPLIAKYIDEGTNLITSDVEAYSADWKSEGFLVLQTANSVYVFRKEVSE